MMFDAVVAAMAPFHGGGDRCVDGSGGEVENEKAFWHGGSRRIATGELRLGRGEAGARRKHPEPGVEGVIEEHRAPGHVNAAKSVAYAFECHALNGKLAA